MTLKDPTNLDIGQQNVQSKNVLKTIFDQKVILNARLQPKLVLLNVEVLLSMMIIYDRRVTLNDRKDQNLGQQNVRNRSVLKIIFDPRENLNVQLQPK